MSNPEGYIKNQERCDGSLVWRLCGWTGISYYVVCHFRFWVWLEWRVRALDKKSVTMGRILLNGTCWYVGLPWIVKCKADHSYIGHRDIFDLLRHNYWGTMKFITQYNWTGGLPLTWGLALQQHIYASSFRRLSYRCQPEARVSVLTWYLKIELQSIQRWLQYCLHEFQTFWLHIEWKQIA